MPGAIQRANIWPPASVHLWREDSWLRRRRKVRKYEKFLEILWDNI